MKKIIRAILFIALLGIGCVLYLYNAYPDVESPLNITVEGTNQQVKRGQYLAEHVSGCIDCHSNRNWNKFSGPIKPGTYGRGGDVFNEKMGLRAPFTPKILLHITSKIGLMQKYIAS